MLFLTNTLIPSPIFLLVHYMKLKIQETLEFYKHFNVSFFIKDIRSHWKGLVKLGDAPVLPLRIQLGMWPDTAGCM